MQTVDVQHFSDASLLVRLSYITVINLKYSNDEDLNITHSGPHKNHKYSGWITTLYGRPVINTEPIFSTSLEAEGYMRRIIIAARKYVVNP